MYNDMNGRKREGISDLPRIKPIASAVLAAAAALLSATAAAVLGSGLLLCLAGAAMAYLFAAGRGFIPVLALPMSYLFAYLFTGDAIRSLTALLSVPIGLVLALCIFRKAPLSITVASLTPVIAVCAGALMCYWLSHIYGTTVLESFKLYKADIASYYDRAAGYITSVTGDDGTSLVSRDTLDAVVSSMKLIIPALCAVLCELLAYGSAKLFRLLSLIFKTDGFFNGPWRVRVALPTSVIFTVCYFVCLIATGNSKSDVLNIIAYSAENLMLILMPLSAITGFHAMFGEGGSFRSARSTGTRVFMIVMCAVFFFMSPLMLFAMLGIWGAFDGMRRASARRGGSGDTRGDM